MADLENYNLENLAKDLENNIIRGLYNYITHNNDIKSLNIKSNIKAYTKLYLGVLKKALSKGKEINCDNNNYKQNIYNEETLERSLKNIPKNYEENQPQKIFGISISDDENFFNPCKEEEKLALEFGENVLKVAKKIKLVKENDDGNLNLTGKDIFNKVFNKVGTKV